MTLFSKYRSRAIITLLLIASQAGAQTDSTKRAVAASLPPVAVSGFIHTDWRNFSNDIENRYTNDITVRRARFDFTAPITSYATLKVTSDVAGGRVQLLDAYGELAYSAALKLRIGKFKAPTTLERAQQTPSNVFVETGATGTIAPNYDVGAQLNGDIAQGLVSYAVGVFDGAVDGASLDNDPDENKDIAGRIQFSPFVRLAGAPFSKFIIGAGGTRGKRTGSTASPEVASYRSAGQATIFNYRSTVVAAGKLDRVAAYVADYIGPISLVGEWIRSTQELLATPTTTTTASGRGRASAYQVYGTIVLTGEDASYRGVTPRRPFKPGTREWGAVELVGRYDQLRFRDDATQAAFTDLTKSVEQASSWTAGVNWYLTKQLRLELNYQVTSFVHGATTGDRPAERELLTRFQTVF